MAKVTSAILLLRKGGSTAWTKDLDQKMISWSNDYINWLETADIALDEAAANKYVLSVFSPSKDDFILIWETAIMALSITINLVP
jgi:hypothetical protein